MRGAAGERGQASRRKPSTAIEELLEALCRQVLGKPHHRGPPTALGDGPPGVGAHFHSEDALNMGGKSPWPPAREGH